MYILDIFVAIEPRIHGLLYAGFEQTSWYQTEHGHFEIKKCASFIQNEIYKPRLSNLIDPDTQ